MNRLDDAPPPLTLNQQMALSELLLEEAATERERLFLAIQNTTDVDELIVLRQAHYAAIQDEEAADLQQREVLWFMASLN